MIRRFAFTTLVLLLSLPIAYSTSADKAAVADDVVRMEVATVILNEEERNFVLLLKPEAETDRRVLPMSIGFEEGRSIAIAFHKIQPPRPLTHDLMRKIIEGYGGGVVSCTITRMENDTFFAELRLKREGREMTIDCRPSDAIALSLRSGTPVLVRRAVLNEHGIDPNKPEQREKPLKT
ncbi:MAG TPA: bifunctional nuclease family protein [Blastocatellia bacterium]|nr:bifunctional nuclease family protein [Blastocatellia bacterium]